MPTKRYANVCCSPDEWSVAPKPCSCANRRVRTRWWPSMIARMGLYQTRTGLKPIGPHRPLADALFRGVTQTCPQCDGDGYIDADDGHSYTDCPACDGLGHLPPPGSPEMTAIREQVLRHFPDAAVDDAPRRLTHAGTAGAGTRQIGPLDAAAITTPARPSSQDLVSWRDLLFRSRLRLTSWFVINRFRRQPFPTGGGFVRIDPQLTEDEIDRRLDELLYNMTGRRSIGTRLAGRIRPRRLTAIIIIGLIALMWLTVVLVKVTR